jgi:hypothetical protein
MSGLRIASWIFVVCALVCAVGIFVPAFEVPINGHVVSKRESISLRTAVHNRNLLRKFLAAYRGTGGSRVGGKIASTLTPHTGGRLKSALEDANDAMDTLSGISDDDAKTLGTALFVAVWSFVGLALAMAVLVFLDAVGGSYRRGRIIGALVISVIVTAAAVAILLGCKAAVFEANDEIGAEVLTLGSAPYAILVGAIGALGSIITMLVLDIRSRRKVA